MSEGPGFLEFFILEASDYIEQLDALLLGGSSSGPDADALQRVARALRGTATMAKLPTFADVAGGVERVGRALQEGVLSWEPALGGALVAAVDDLKTLLHAARTWSPTDDQRATSRSAELAQFAPPRPFLPPRESGQQHSSVAGSAFLAAEASNIAAGFELLGTRAGAPDTASNLLARIRALRGVAGVKEVGPLADILEATEETTRALESGEASLRPESKRLLEAAAEYLRVVSSALRFGGDVNAPSAARDAFLAAHEAWTTRTDGDARVVPVATLFYADGGPGVVEAANNPPTSAADRFRLELVSHSEHLRQVVDAARHASDASAVERARRDLRRGLRALEATADSFGEQQIAELIAARAPALEELDTRTLSALEELAGALGQPGAQSERLIARLRDLGTTRPRRSSSEVRQPAAATPPEAEARPSAPASVQAPTEPAEAARPAAPAEPSAAPTPTTSEQPPAELPAVAASAAALLESSLAALEALASEPWISPVDIPEERVVPIESLLYRGRAALDRAVELRDQIRESGSTIAKADLDELFDLLELARAE